MSTENDLATYEEKRQEGAERLKQLGIFEETARQFIEDGRVSASRPPWGACFWIDDKTQKAVAKFEKKTGGLVYHIIETGTGLGVMRSFLYVSKHKKEWPADRLDIADRVAFCYVDVTGGPGFSEFGTIMYKLGPAGGLLRTQ